MNSKAVSVHSQHPPTLQKIRCIWTVFPGFKHAFPLKRTTKSAEINRIKSLAAIYWFLSRRSADVGNVLSTCLSNSINSPKCLFKTDQLMCLDVLERLGCAYGYHSCGTSAAHWTYTSNPHHACQPSLMQTGFTLKGCHMALLHARSQQGLSDHLTAMRSNQLWTSSSEICFKWKIAPLYLKESLGGLENAFILYAFVRLIWK